MKKFLGFEMFRIELLNKDKKNVIFPETLDEICRVCLKQAGTINIFTESTAKKGYTFVDLIISLSHVQVQKDDSLPSKICELCSTKLNEFFTFKEQIETCQVILFIALGKVIIQPPGRLKNLENSLLIQNNECLNKETISEYGNRIFTVANDENLNSHLKINFNKSSISTKFLKGNVQELGTAQNQTNKVESQANNTQNDKKNEAQDSILYNILSKKEEEHNDYVNCIEENFNLKDIDSIMECWESYKYCIACNSNRKTDPECSFYKFPNDQERCSNWIKIMKLYKLNNLSAEECHKKYLLCSKHFKTTMFCSKDKTRLKRIAMPTDFYEEGNKRTHTIGIQTDSSIFHIKSIESPPENVAGDISVDQIITEDSDSKLFDFSYTIQEHSYSRDVNNQSEKEAENAKRTKFQCVTINEEGKKEYTCCFCGEKYEDRKEYYRHKFREYKKRRPKPIIRMPCSVCGKLIRKERVRDHLNTHTNEKPYVCEYCGKSFHSGPNLSDHKKTHRGDKEHVCDMCGKGFYFLNQLKDHVTVHDKIPSYICHICGFFAWTRSTFMQHEKRHRMGLENFREIKRNVVRHKRECEVCLKKFPSNAHLIIHMRSHTGEKPYECMDCGKRFSLKGHLYTHKRLHTGEKPFSCDYCGKKFALNGNLQQHIRTHTGEKPHTCETCLKGFYTNSALRKHRRIHDRHLFLTN